MPLLYFKYENADILHTTLSLLLDVATATSLPMIEIAFRLHWSLLLLERIAIFSLPEREQDMQWQKRSACNV